MKKLLLGICFFAIQQTVHAQLQIKLRIADALTGAELGGSSIDAGMLGNFSANESGEFSLTRLKAGTYHFRITSIGYQAFDTSLTLRDASLTLSIALKRFSLFMQPIEVRALRAGDKTPFSKTNLTKKDVEQNNLGQDLPFILSQTPSVVINSDAGNGIGYTGIYIRGTDATRINMTLNGIPYNDAESQSIYFVDLPDFASSVNSIQIQRGVGTSSNGAGAFGASINFSTNEFNEKPYGEFNNSYGSFNTLKNTIKAGSGLIDGHFSIDARLSRITSDGFIDRATSDLKSFYISTAYYTGKTSIRFNILSGTEKTYQAWNGIPEAKLDGNPVALLKHYEDNIGSLYFTQQDSLNLFRSNNRTYNYFTYANQTDNYQQDHYQLFFNHAFNESLSLNTAGFVTRGRGYYEEYEPAQLYSAYGLANPVYGNDTVTTTDLIRQRWLSNYFYGGIFSLQYRKESTELTAGGGWNRYNGRHYGNVIWAQEGGIPDNYQYYREPADKNDANFYAKWQHTWSRHWTGYADMQYRNVIYIIDGFDDNPGLKVDEHYHFFNPKAGITYTNNDYQAFFSYAQATHEPNHDDFEASPGQLPTPETLHDFELTLSQKKTAYNWSITGYYMRYHNQLVLTGKINDVGEYTRTNIPQSYRLGAELQGGIKPAKWFSADGNLTLSDNKVLNYTEYVDDYDSTAQKAFHYNKADIAFSPAITAALNINFQLTKNLLLTFPAKYVSKAYLDNTQNEGRKMNAYYVQNLKLIYTIPSGIFKSSNFIFQLNNAFNRKYEPNGYTYSYISNQHLTNENFYFPMAGTNFMLAFNLRL